MPHTRIKLSGPSVRLRNGSTMPMGMGMHGSATPAVMNHSAVVYAAVRLVQTHSQQQ
jgi:hypothetical protein